MNATTRKGLDACSLELLGICGKEYAEDSQRDLSVLGLTTSVFFMDVAGFWNF